MSIVIAFLNLAVTVMMEVFGEGLRAPLAIFFITIFTLPGFLRYLICYKWELAETTVKVSRDLSQPFFHWKGVSMSSCYEAEIEYHVDATSFTYTITSNSPFKETSKIYYDPINPSIFTQNKALGYDGGGFILLIVTTFILYFLLGREPGHP